MVYITDQTRRDSKTLKTISLIALVYLPATLISVSALHYIRGQTHASVVRVQLRACSADLESQRGCGRVWNIDRCLYIAHLRAHSHHPPCYEAVGTKEQLGVD
jgi:hypothetical protein